MKIIRTKNTSKLAKAFAEPLSPEAEVEYRKLTVVEELLQFMKRQGINRADLAELMGVNKSRITKMLNGSENLTINTLVRAGLAVGADLQQTFVPKGQRGHWVASEPPVAGSGEKLVVLDFGQPKEVKKAPTPEVSHSIAATDDESAA
ncbi:MAG: helix-turn-helix domain-containing protein [Verrucomicrobiae bacterium]|nr:helix-turn-helix domain-containing protein [Verrucomicrobiae bacterium]